MVEINTTQENIIKVIKDAKKGQTTSEVVITVQELYKIIIR